MTQQQRDNLRGTARTIERTAEDAAKLRNNPDCQEKAYIQQCLLLIETKLQCMAEALRDMADQDSDA